MADKRFLMASVAFFVAVGGSTSVLAQSVKGSLEAMDARSNFQRDRNIAVRQRGHEGYEALGLSLGAFQAWPKISARVGTDDNIYGSTVRKQSDTIVSLAPELTLNSTWSRHSLDAYVRGTMNRYSDFDTEDNEDFAAGFNGRIDISRQSNLTGGFGHSNMVEPRTASNTAQSAKDPIQYATDTANVAAMKEFNRLKVSGRYDWMKYNYDDGRSAAGVVLEQDDRDRTVTKVTGRADYAISPDTALFIQASADKRDYRLAKPAVTVARDSDGVEILAGANFELGATARGEIGAGYIKQSYNDASFKDIDGMGARAQVEWFPTQLTTVTVSAARTVEDAAIPGSSGYLSTNYSAMVDHELLRNVILSGQVSYGLDDYRGTIKPTPLKIRDLDREDKRVAAGVSATYLLNHHAGVTVGYTYSEQKSSGLDKAFDFKVNKVGATLTLQY